MCIFTTFTTPKDDLEEATEGMAQVSFFNAATLIRLSPHTQIFLDKCEHLLKLPSLRYSNEGSLTF